MFEYYTSKSWLGDSYGSSPPQEPQIKSLLSKLLWHAKQICRFKASSTFRCTDCFNSACWTQQHYPVGRNSCSFSRYKIVSTFLSKQEAPGEDQLGFMKWSPSQICIFLAAVSPPKFWVYKWSLLIHWESHRCDKVFVYPWWRLIPCLLNASIVAKSIWSISEYFRSFLSSDISCPAWIRQLHRPIDAPDTPLWLVSHSPPPAKRPWSKRSPSLNYQQWCQP